MTLAIDCPTDEPLLFPGLTWQQFKDLEPLLDIPEVRLSFLDGVLEIRRMPGKTHKVLKRRLSSLLDVYFDLVEIDYTPTGSMMLEDELANVRREVDLSYEIGFNRIRPDIAIEVVVSSGGIDKLQAYHQLKIPEVWFYQSQELSLYSMKADETGYVEIQRSQVLPGLNVELLKDCINIENHHQAVKAFDQAF
jgi:Uma2 family endonuclease